VVHDPALGWLSFGGNLESKGGAIRVVPLDAFRSRLYLAPLGLWITLDAGKLRQAVFEPRTGLVRITLDPATSFTAEAHMRIEQPAKLAGVGTYSPASELRSERDAFVIPLGAATTEVTLRAK
jgi:hypothetical protein